MSEGKISLTIPEYTALVGAQERYDKALKKMCDVYAMDTVCNSCDMHRWTSGACRHEECAKHWYGKVLSEVDDEGR